MRRRSTALTALIALMLLGACLAADAQGVRFITPEDGDTVRDMVRIQATKPQPDSGWISYKIERAGSGDFVAATTSPFNYLWNTRARNEQGNELYPDGQYTLTAVALSASGRREGEASITVTLTNSVSAAQAPQRVELDLFYDRNQEVFYRAEGEWAIRPASGEEEPEDVWKLAKNYDGALVANWKNKVMSPTYAAGHAVLHIVIGSSGAQAGTSEVKALDHAGKALTYIALRDGEMRRKHSDEPRFELAEITVPLPDRPVKAGDSWQARMDIWPDPLKGTMATAAAAMMGEGMGMGMEMYDPMMGAMPGMEMGTEGGAATAETKPPTRIETRAVRATHTVEGFEWVMGYPTARIRSTYNVDNDKVTVPSGPAAGGVGGMGEEFGGAPGEVGMMPGMGFGDMGMGGEMGMGGAQGAEKDTSYVGERLTYWSWDLRRPIRIVDTITHTVEIERAAQMTEMGMGMGMEGMPMEDVMPPEMMDPGMMPRGAYDPAMGGYGMGFGMEAMQMEPPKPMKVNIRVSLVIQEVGL